MELWIRSQDRKSLVKVNEIKFYERNGHYYIGDGFEDNYASYKSKERALEVLDDIQNKMKSSFLLKIKDDLLLEHKTCENAKKYFEILNDINCIVNDSMFDLEPINKNVNIYEMPKE